MGLNNNALIDTTYFYQMYVDEDWLEDEKEKTRIEEMINAVSSEFEKFCNRKLKARDYTYDPEDTSDYSIENLHYAIFDAPQGSTFWFPTYPVNSITEFIISGTAITVAASNDYDASDGYMLYPRRGKIIYGQGFDYSYLQNVQIKWNGGYDDDHESMSDLKYLCFSAIKQFINAPDNEMLQSERIGNYTYKLMSPEFQRELRGLAPTIFENLMSFKRVAIG
jgi:hypothetical protein